MKRNLICKMIEIGSAECQKAATLEDVRYWRGYNDALIEILNLKGVIDD